VFKNKQEKTITAAGLAQGQSEMSFARSETVKTNDADVVSEERDHDIRIPLSFPAAYTGGGGAGAGDSGAFYPAVAF